MRVRSWIILLLLSAAVLAACSPGAADAVPTESAASVAEPAVTTAAGDPTEAPDTAVEAAAITDFPTDIPTDSPTEVPPTDAVVVVDEAGGGAACTYKPTLEATDPSSVSLASGEVQLVEFFAFW